MSPNVISSNMEQLATTAEAIAATTKKSEKVRILAAYLRSLPKEEASATAVFLSGRAFPAWEETTLQVGGALVVRVILELSGKAEPELEKAYRKTGDLGAAACELLRAVPVAVGVGSAGPPITAVAAARAFREIAAARGPAAKAALLRELLARASPLAAKYLIKIVTGELRIGLKENLVEEAIALAYDAPLPQVQRANMLLGDIGETLRLAVTGELDAAHMRLFHPLGFMLASPVESSEEAFAFFAHAQIEDKYDGIRAQAHCGGSPERQAHPAARVEDRVRLFSRTLDDITESFPELMEPLRAFAQVGAILDGEVVAWDFRHKRALPFSTLQKRLGRKRVTPAVMRAVPVAYVVFDVLYAGELAIDRPLRERGAMLDRVFAEAQERRLLLPQSPMSTRLEVEDPQGKLAFEPALISTPTAFSRVPSGEFSYVNEDHEGEYEGREFQSGGGSPAEPAIVLRAPALRADSPAHLETLFAQAQARGNEGLMIKDLESTYAPGRRGRSWVKWKRELATLDVVVTSVEWGHGKRARVLSDYTFAVRDPQGVAEARAPLTPSGEPLVNIGKAYSGLTDREIAEMTQWFLEHTVADRGFWREVEPKIVIEVAFNAVMRSGRHNSGYALRFPRILRLRPDKSPDEADTLERVREIYQRQKLPLSA